MQETPTSSLTTFLAERNLLYIQQYSILSIHLTELFKVLHGIVVEALFKVTILELVREVGLAGLPMLLLLLLVEGGGEGGVALGLGQGVQCAEILGRSELARTVFRYKQACIL